MEQVMRAHHPENASPAPVGIRGWMSGERPALRAAMTRRLYRHGLRSDALNRRLSSVGSDGLSRFQRTTRCRRPAELRHDRLSFLRHERSLQEVMRAVKREVPKAPAMRSPDMR